MKQSPWLGTPKPVSHQPASAPLLVLPQVLPGLCHNILSSQPLLPQPQLHHWRQPIQVLFQLKLLILNPPQPPPQPQCLQIHLERSVQVKLLGLGQGKCSLWQKWVSSWLPLRESWNLMQLLQPTLSSLTSSCRTPGQVCKELIYFKDEKKL